MTSPSNVKIDWVFRTPKEPFIIKVLPRVVTENHPLRSTLSLNYSEKKLDKEKKNDGTAKNSHITCALDGTDPLSLLAAESNCSLDCQITPNNEKKLEFGMKDWSEMRTTILNKFTTSHKLSMASNFLSFVEKGPKAHHNPIVQHRLEQLDDIEDVSTKEINYLTQQQYVENINQLNEELVDAWNKNYRVKALKIAIQCSKLLADTSVIQFYPSKFTLITDVLDIFGSLVYERLKAKAAYHPPGSTASVSLPENFTCDMVDESAKETCRNWFYKIASIRELVPRLYVEAAILRSYNFLTNSELNHALARLTRMVRGIGDPLVAAYTRCYLCRVGMSVSSIDRNFININFTDFLMTYDQIFSGSVRIELSKQKVDFNNYLELYTPAVDWILQEISNRASDATMDEVLTQCAKKKKNGLLLSSLMRNLKGVYIASRADNFVNYVAASSQGVPDCMLINALGECLQFHLVENPNIIFEKIWKLITRLNNVNQFMHCANSWTLFIVKNFSYVEINKFLGDIIGYIGTNKSSHSQILQSIITTIILNIPEPGTVFMMDKFLPVLDLFDSENSKASVCRQILQIFTTTNELSPKDPVTTDSLLFIAKILHDSVNALTIEDEKKQIGTLISKLIHNITFGLDFEKQLKFFVDARGTFTSIDIILSTLVHCVNKLGMQTGQIVKSQHTKKTADFVRACAAYAFITIPSIESIITRLQLYLLTAQVCVFNQCLGQADASIKAALTLAMELPAFTEINGKSISTEGFLSEYVCNLVSTLIVVPDCPDQGVFYLVRGLINMLSHYANENNMGMVANLFFSIIDMLSTCVQPLYPYHVKNVDSNDIFYGSDPKFISEINKICSVVVEDLLNYLKILGSGNRYNKQVKLSFDLFVRIILHGDLSNPGMVKLAIKLWNLCNRHGYLDQKLAERTLNYLKKKESFVKLYEEDNISI